jgi:hypothetical protein
MTRDLPAIAAILVLLAGAASTAGAATCAAGRYRAGCVGPNGAVAAGPNGVHTASTAKPTCAAGVYRAGCVGPNGAVVAGPAGVHGASTTAPGTQVTGARGNTATKGVQAGCGWVNGQRVCR